MPEPRHVDVAILGAGTAGLGARRAAQIAGKTALMIDPGPHGTTCARVGCMPSKLLLAVANAAQDARKAEGFGVRTAVTIDGPAVLARVRSERDRFVGFVLRAIQEAQELDELLEERATVVAPGVLQAGEQMVHYERLVLATGTVPVVPPPYRKLPREVVLTNDDVFELRDLPESVLVVGLGVIGLELGQAMHRLGVRTLLVGIGGAVGPIGDPEVLAVAREALSKELDLHPEHELHELSVEDGRVRIRFTDSQGVARDETFEKVLLAAGRRHSLGSLGLENLGAQADERGNYPIDEGTLQLADLPVFVAGDANGFHPLLHEAVQDGKIAGRNAASWPELVAPLRKTPLSVVFCKPQIALVGTSYRGLVTCDASVGEVDFSDQGRARVDGQNAGLLRVYADKHTHRLLGAELVGPDAEHLAHLLAWIIQLGATVEQALDMPFYHPVVEEGLRTALRDLSSALKARRPIHCRVSEQGVGS